MSRLNPRWVEGRRIVRVSLNPVVVEGVTMHDPEIELDNGSLLRFLTEECPNGGDYGTSIIYVPPLRSRHAEH